MATTTAIEADLGRDVRVVRGVLPLALDPVDPSGGIQEQDEGVTVVGGDHDLEGVRLPRENTVSRVVAACGRLPVDDSVHACM